MKPRHLRAPALYNCKLSPSSGLHVSCSTVEGSGYRDLMMGSWERFLFQNKEFLITRWVTSADCDLERAKFGTQLSQMIKLSQHEAIRERTSPSVELSSNFDSTCCWRQLKNSLHEFKCAERFSPLLWEKIPPLWKEFLDLLKAECLIHVVNLEQMLTVRCLCCEPLWWELKSVTGRFVLVPVIPGDLAPRAAQCT